MIRETRLTIKQTSLQIILSLLFFFTINCQVFGQQEKLINSKKLLKDLDQFEKFISAHPDPFTHISESLFKENLNAVRSSLNKPHTRFEFWKKLSSLTALIRDGHSSVSLPKYWMVKKRRELGCFPYEMYLTNSNELFVRKSFNDGKIKPASRIISINGISIDNFLNSIDPFISYEKLSFRNTLIDDNFEKYLYIAFNSTTNLTFKYFMQDTLETVVQNMPLKEWKKFQKNDKEERELLISQGKPYVYKKIKDGIGTLKIYGFLAKDLDMYNHFLLKTFKTIQRDGIHSLIIDVRGNYGGWPKIASELFHYIHNGYFKTMAKSSMKVSYPYRNYFYDRYPNLRTNGSVILKQRHYVDLLSILNNKIGTYIDEDTFFNEEPIKENFEFQGDVYLLTNRDSYSAASSFASTFQCYGMGMIIGEETGGTKIFRANPILKEMNNTRIRVRMSTTKLYTTCYNEEFEGVTPDIKYSPTIFDLLSDLDIQLIFAQRVIKKIKKIREEQINMAQKIN